MAAINQRIPNFLGGVSQQPDTIKFPGQVRVCDNAVPDVTFGLVKRPAGEFVKRLTNANDNGYWYEILRDGDEKYLAQMTALSSYSGTKPIRIWNLLTGVEQSLTNGNGDALFDYMQQTGTTKPYAIQTIQDTTIITNPKQTVGTTGVTHSPLNSGNYAFARLDTIAYNTEYILYAGATPTPNTYYRVTALSVTKQSGSPSGNTQTGNTWDDSEDDSRYAGLGQFSFSDSACENIEGHVTVNAASYVEKQRYNWEDGSTGTVDNDGNTTGTTSGAGEDFIGYTQIYKVRYTAQVTLKDGGLIKTTSESTALAKSHTITIEGVNYTVNVDAVEEVETYEGVAGISFYKSPRNPDEGSLSMAKIVKNLHDGVSNVSNVTSEIVGSGLYLHGTAAPTVSFLGGAINENMNVIGNTAQDVSRLPSQCKQGYIAQIANDDNTDSDNYYVKFIADNGSSGSGKWEECVRPNNFSSGSDPMVKGLDPDTMPHALVNNRNGSFTFKRLDETTATADSNDLYWKYREVGDGETNPFPSINGKEIQKIFFHRNRLGLVADEQIVLSRPGDYFNLFIVSAITASDDNPVDITVSDIKPAFVNHVLEIQKGMMMFSDNGQFLLFTESDIFSPKTARLKKIASYECDASLQPRDMGTSVMFTSNVSAYTRAFEATILDDDIPPKILEQTRVVPEFVPKEVTLSANSAALGIVTFGEKNSSEIFHYKYFDAGERRDQSAWYTWTLTGTMQYMLYSAGSFFTVTKQGSDFVLSRHEYVTDTNATSSYTVGGVEANVGSPKYTARWFDVCLDNMLIPSTITYTAQTTTAPEKTVLTFTASAADGYTPTGATNFYAVGLNGNQAGLVVKADSVGTNSATFNGINMTGWEIAVGYSYTSILELPDYHLALEANKYDVNGSLRISGLNFQLGVSGPMQFHLTAKNTYTDSSGTVTKEFDDYIQYESGMTAGLANVGKPPSELNKSVRVPIQKKNDKYNLQVKIPDPFSTALISGSWDGNYNPRRHVRR